MIPLTIDDLTPHLLEMFLQYLHAAAAHTIATGFHQQAALDLQTANTVRDIARARFEAELRETASLLSGVSQLNISDVTEPAP